VRAQHPVVMLRPKKYQWRDVAVSRKMALKQVFSSRFVRGRSGVPGQHAHSAIIGHCGTRSLW
jgi:hypothetical protein